MKRAATASPAGRPIFAADEKRLPWPGLLLQLQPITDGGVARALCADGRKLACARGCTNCCRSHMDIPV